MRKILFLFSLFVMQFSARAQINETSDFASFTATSPGTCSPVMVTFTSNFPGASFFNWDFNDGNFSTSPNPVHVFNQAGFYVVQVFYYDASSVFIGNDYMHLYIKGDPNGIQTSTPLACINDRIDLQVNVGEQNPVGYQFTWNYGDGVVETMAYPHAQHIYSSPGVYNVTCQVVGPCGTFNESTTVTISTNVPITNAWLNVYPTLVCPTDRVEFYYSGASSIFLQYGDGTFSNSDDFHFYNNWGISYYGHFSQWLW